MNLPFNPYASILLLSGVTTIALSLVVFRRLKPNERSFSLVLGLAGWWAIGSAGEHFSSTYSSMLFWVSFEYIGICFLPAALLIFTRVFISGNKLTVKPLDGLVYAIPVFTLLLVCTNRYHHFYYESLTVDRTNVFPILAIEPGFWYYIFTAYWYIVLCWCIYLLSKAFKNADSIYQKQKRIIIYALVVPWLANIAYKFGVSPHHNADLTPFGFIITALIICYGLLRYKLLDVIPAAREKIFESMQDGVIVLDSNLKVIDINMRMEEVMRMSKKRIVGRYVKDLFPLNQKLVQAVDKKKKCLLEIELSQQQQEYYYEIDINILLGKTLDYSGSILVFHDITQRKKDAISLQALNQLKDRLFSIIAHDLRSPVRNVTAILQLIDESFITEKDFRVLLPELSKNLNYTSNLLDNLLQWSKSQLQGELIHRAAVDMKDVIQHEVLYYQLKAAEKGVTLTESLKPDTLAYVDTEMIRVVIRNLISNAIKFCKSDDSITISSTINANNEVVICIKDTGSGMQTETVEKLFTSYMFTNRGTNNEKGTGLGLQICKEFVEKNNGRIWVNTEWSKGSEFYFSVPMATSPSFKEVII